MYWALVLCFFAAYICCLAIYRIAFHPLSKYPGPFLAKITSLYAAYQAWHCVLHLDITQCHEKYGNFVRYGPDRIVINTSKGLHDIYGHNKNVRKSKSYLPMVPSKDAWSTLTLIDKRAHQERRKLVCKAFSDPAFRTFEPAMLRHMDLFHHLLADPTSSTGWSCARDMSAHYIMSDFGFGQNISLQTDRKLDYLPQVFQTYSWQMGVYEQYPKLRHLKVERIAKLMRFGHDLRTKFEDWSNRFASGIISQPEKRSRFSLIRDAKDSIGQGLKEVELRSEGAFLMLAGSETTAIAMSALFFYLVRHTEIYAKLALEIRTTFADLEEIRSGEKLQSCSYLSACIAEALRMSPPVPGIPWREVEDGGIQLDTDYVPAGYTVGTSIYSIQHNPNYFPSPYNFDPNRWLGLDPSNHNEKARLANAAYSPFSIGPRACAGRSIGLAELHIMFARTIFAYDFRIADGPLGFVGQGSGKNGDLRSCESEFQLFAHVTSYCEGPWVTFKAR